MPEKQKIEEAIFAAINEINRTLPKDRQMKKSVDTVLFGPSGHLDSLGITLFIVAVEQKIEEALGTPVSLTQGKSISGEHSPLQTVGTLLNHIASLLEIKIND